MRKDDHLIFEALQNTAAAENTVPGKRRLKYDYEWVTAFLPRDIDINNKEGEDKVLNLAFQETLRLLVPNRKNPRLAARNIFGDEDFPMEIISQYAWYQKHGFPNASADGWYDVQETEENAENTQPADVSNEIRIKLGQAYNIVKGLIALLDNTPTGQTPYNEMALTHLVNLQEDLKELTMMLQDRMLKQSENAENADARKERTQRKWQMNKDRWAKWKMENPEAAAKHAAKKMGKSAENAENEPHGYPQGITAIQNTLINELKKRGFQLTKISHEDKERDKYPTVFMSRKSNFMHSVAEISGMGEINGEHYKAYLAGSNSSENAPHGND